MATRRSAADAAVFDAYDSSDVFEVFEVFDGLGRLDGLEWPDEHDIDLVVDSLGLVGAARHRRR